MPAKAPLMSAPAGDLLARLGARLHARRKQLSVTATAAAESAGMSRVTWHRIERGEPSVAMGAYMSAITALGLTLELVDPAEPARPVLPERVRLADFPELRRLAWQQPGVTELAPAEALALYERNWRHLDDAALQPQERALILALVSTLGGGRALV